MCVCFVRICRLKRRSLFEAILLFDSIVIVLIYSITTVVHCFFFHVCGENIQARRALSVQYSTAQNRSPNDFYLFCSKACHIIDAVCIHFFLFTRFVRFEHEIAKTVIIFFHHFFSTLLLRFQLS